MHTLSMLLLLCIFVDVTESAFCYNAIQSLGCKTICESQLIATKIEAAKEMECFFLKLIFNV